MKELGRFELALHSMVDEAYHFEYEIDGRFFDELRQELVQNGNFFVRVDLEKNAEIIVLDIQHDGKVSTACDRCLEEIDLPVNDKVQIIIKFVEEDRMDDEVTYLLKGTERLNLAPFIFEAISLSLPLVNRYDCERDEKAPCNDKVLSILEGREQAEREETSPVWDELKNLNLES